MAMAMPVLSLRLSLRVIYLIDVLCILFTHFTVLYILCYLYWNVPCGDTSCRTLIDVCVCVCLSADISLNCAKNDSTDYPEILWVCWV